MPYLWQDGPEPGTHRLSIWPHRPLGRSGFVWLIGATAAGLALPLIAVIGRAVLWGLLPFALATIAGLWLAVRHHDASGPREEVEITPARLTIHRTDPGRAARDWQANPYWVRLSLRDGPVEDYLTLTDGGREVELGACLSPPERRALRADLARVIAGLRSADG